MTENNQNFPVVTGDSKLIQTTIKDDDGTALDLTNATVEWGVFDRKNETTLISLSSDSDSQLTITDAANGEVEVELLDSDTSGWSPDEYHHEMRVTDANGNVSTVMRGRINVTGSAFN